MQHSVKHCLLMESLSDLLKDTNALSIKNFGTKISFQYICDETLSTSEAYISDVDEPSSCEYIIKVKTGSLCKLDVFSSHTKPREPLSIMCRPLLEQRGVEQFLEKVSEERLRKVKFVKNMTGTFFLFMLLQA